MLARCLDASLLLGPTFTERKTSPEITVLHKSGLVVGIGRVLEELIVLLNQRNKFFAGNHPILPHTKSVGDGRGQYTAAGEARVNVAGVDGSTGLFLRIGEEAGTGERSRSSILEDE